RGDHAEGLGWSDLCRDCGNARHPGQHRRVALPLRPGRTAQTDEGGADVNEHEHELFEAELRRIQPAKLPDDFAERLVAAQPGLPGSSERAPRASQPVRWWTLISWFVPTTASAAALVALAIWLKASQRRTSMPPSTAAVPSALRADDVEIDRQLIGTF